MSKDNRHYFITTPIYYVNARPHIGHAYTTIVCDAVARRRRQQGDEVFFLTGTDEHGQKIERSAAAAGVSPQQFADRVSGEFRALWERMDVSFDKFIRTTSEEHKRGVQKMFALLKEKGYIYKGSYTGQYCVSDEAYIESTEPGAVCPDCGRVTETVKEENYFFKLSAFEEPLLKLYAEHPEFIRPEARRNEVMAFVRGGLKDLSISRTTFRWGIPVADDPEHVVYVWLDALCNYITALGWNSRDPEAQKRFAQFWPADVHMVGKEIIRFHCVYWPAFLMAAGLPLPKGVVAHGWLLFEESKMSKSRGNIVRSETILDVLGQDALRYFLMREVPFGADGSFSFDALVGRYNSDLANGLGNLASRTMSMINRYFEGEMPYPSAAAAKTEADDRIAKLAGEVIEEFDVRWRAFEFHKALEAAWSLVGAVDKYIVENAPWQIAEKDDADSRARLATILYTSAEALRIVTALAHPVIPESTARIWAQLGLGDIKTFDLNSLKWAQLGAGAKLGVVEGVFPRADKSAIERMQQLEEEKTQQALAEKAAQQADKPSAPTTADAPADAAAPSLPEGLSPIDAEITIDDFCKIDLRVGKILTAEKVEKADKLLKFTIDIGLETRTIVAGIAKAYAPETLVGRKVVIVANLAPRKLRGILSQGMIVAASLENTQPVVASFLEDVPVGARLK